MREKKKEEKEREKLIISRSIISTVRRVNGFWEYIYFTLEMLSVFIYKFFVSLCYVYVRAAPITSLQDAIVNLPSP